MSSFKITRRQFLKWVTASAGVLGLSQADILKVEEALAAVTDPNCTPGFPSTLARVLWLTGADCGGCPTTLLNYLADPNDPDPVLRTIANNAIPGFPLFDIEALTPQGADGNIDIAEVVTEIVTVDWHYIVQAAAGDLANQHMATLRDSAPFVLAIDGAIPTPTAQYPNGHEFCTIFSLPGNWKGVPADPWYNYVTYKPVDNRTEFSMAGGVLWLASSPHCLAVVADGTCASFGGVPAASASLPAGGRGNLTGAKSAWEWINQSNNLNKIIVNIPGCPPNSDWQIGTIAAALLELLGVIPGILLNNLDNSLDHKGRPKLTYTGFYHVDATYVFCNDCPRFNPVEGGGQPGPKDLCDAAKTNANPNGKCLMNRGCTGWMAGPAHIRPDCPTRKWNKFEDMSKNNWCVGNNMPCQGCASPGFPDYCSPFYKKTKYI